MVRKKISELTEKTTIVDNDVFVIVDSAASPTETKKIKWSNVNVSVVAAAHKASHQTGGADEVSIASLAGTPTELTTHAAAADPHTGYRLESADHTHQSTGAQAGQLDHGLALTGLTDDDHTQYRLESADHTHQSTGAQAGKLDHGLALDGLGDDDHTQYRLESADHTHQTTGAQAGKLDHGLALDGLGDDDHTIYQKEDLLTTQGDIPYATAASTWARLPKGTASQFLRMNAGATAPEWTSGSQAIPQNGIIIWAGTIANIPAGFVICDGNNGTPNLLAKFIEGVATAATNPGTTGGEVNQQVDYYGEAAPIYANLTGQYGISYGWGNMGAGGWGTSIRSSADTAGATAGRAQLRTRTKPPFYDVAFIMKT